jgi:hypothetical protein
MRAKAGATEPSVSQHPQRPLHDAGERILRAMTDTLAQQHPVSAAEALKVLRRGYPEIPLALRIAALRARSAK